MAVNSSCYENDNFVCLITIETTNIKLFGLQIIEEGGSPIE